jgi:aminoglycoside phosphotransferase (APT) family kinase protein
MDDLLTRLTTIYDEEVARGAKAVEADDIPLNYESITPEWLTHHLCKGVSGAKVVSHSLDDVDDGTTNRRRIFVEYNAEGKAAGLPASVFCKASQSLVHRYNNGNIGAVHAEVTFFDKVRPLVDGDVPTAYHAAYNPESFSSILVFEDIGTEVEFCDHTTTIDFEEACSQVDLLADIHGKFQDDPRYDKDTLNLGTWSSYFASAAKNELQEYCDKGFLAAEAEIPSRLFARAGEVWDATLAAVAEHDSLPQTLVHGDCHLKQWYKRPNKSMGVADWQLASFGPWARDLPYMMATSLSVENRRAWEKQLIERYLDRMGRQGATVPSFDEAFTLYRRNLLPALAWWTVTLTPGPNYPDMQPPETSLVFINRITHAIDDLDVLDAF